MDASAFWDGVADSYSKRPIQNMDQHDRTVERTLAYLGPEASVLEAGCGTGTIAMRLAPSVGHVLATDFSAALLEIARQRQAENGVENVTFAKAAIADLPDDTFDMVASYNVLHLIRDVDGAVASLASRVKPGGVLVIKTGVLADTWQGNLLRFVIGAMRLVGKAPFVGFYTTRKIEAALMRGGLEIVESEAMGGKVAARFIVARKP